MLKKFTLVIIALLAMMVTHAQDCENYFFYKQSSAFDFTFRGFMESPTQALYNWDFGDGNTASGKEVTHTFSTAGDFQVCLFTETYDSLGNPCNDTSCQTITAGNPPGCVAFFFGNASPANPQNWIFTDFSSGTPTSYEWDFGDGATSSLQNPIHAYLEAGTYNVCLSITDTANNCSDTYCEEIIVFPNPIDCESDFTYSSADLLTFDFTGYMLDTTQTDVDYAWDFGDGNTGNGQNITYTFEAPPTPTYFNVCLTTTFNQPSGGTCEYTSCRNVFVGNTTNCQALFNYSFGAQPLSIVFIDISTGNPTLWEWDFGDENISTEQNPTHIYERDGTYTVCLTITNENNGCTSTLCQDVNVTNVPPPVLCHNTIQTTMGSDIFSYNFHGEAFSDTMNVSATSTFTWNFGDGTSASGQDAQHTYTETGNYAVRLGTISILNGTDTCTAYSYDSIFISDEDYCVGGNVYIESQVTADQAEVHLFAHDPDNNNIVFTYTTETDNQGSYLFEGVNMNEEHDYYLQAGLSSGSSNFGAYAPTYYTSSIHWGDATLAVLEMCPAGMNHDILLHAYTAVATGNGSISGIVYSDETREVLADVEILLMDESMEVKGYTYTDIDGGFTFSAVAYGTYYIYPEIVGIETDGFMITIGEDEPQANLNIAIIDGAAVLSVEDYSPVSIIHELYPNPANTLINVTLSAEKETDVQLTVYNQLGQAMINEKSHLVKGINTLSLELEGLPESIYYLRVQARQGKPLMRSFVKFD